MPQVIWSNTQNADFSNLNGNRSKPLYNLFNVIYVFIYIIYTVWLFVSRSYPRFRIGATKWRFDVSLVRCFDRTMAQRTSEPTSSPHNPHSHHAPTTHEVRTHTHTQHTQHSTHSTHSTHTHTHAHTRTCTHTRAHDRPVLLLQFPCSPTRLSPPRSLPKVRIACPIQLLSSQPHIGRSISVACLSHSRRTQSRFRSQQAGGQAANRTGSPDGGSASRTAHATRQQGTGRSCGRRRE